jgi:hypothetical protein
MTSLRDPVTDADRGIDHCDKVKVFEGDGSVAYELWARKDWPQAVGNVPGHAKIWNCAQPNGTRWSFTPGTRRHRKLTHFVTTSPSFASGRWTPSHW